jgi:hypothetical protein
MLAKVFRDLSLQINAPEKTLQNGSAAGVNVMILKIFSQKKWRRRNKFANLTQIAAIWAEKKITAIALLQQTAIFSPEIGGENRP